MYLYVNIETTLYLYLLSLLLVLACSTLEICYRMSLDYVDTLEGLAQNRYKEKLRVAGLQHCPYRKPADEWLNDPTKWPEVAFPDIYFYLVFTPGT